MTASEALAALAEGATEGVLRTALDLFHGCAHKGEEGRCGRMKGGHPQRDHREWEPYYAPSEAIRLVEMLAGLSRHEGRVDRELGLDKRERREMVPWLVGVDVGVFKRLGPVEQDRMLLEAMGAREAEVVVDVEVEEGVDGGAGGVDSAGGDDVLVPDREVKR